MSDTDLARVAESEYAAQGWDVAVSRPPERSTTGVSFEADRGKSKLLVEHSGSGWLVEQIRYDGTEDIESGSRVVTEEFPQWREAMQFIRGLIAT